MVKRSFSNVVLIVLMGVLSACGGSDSASDASQSNQSSLLIVSSSSNAIISSTSAASSIAHSSNSANSVSSISKSILSSSSLFNSLNSSSTGTSSSTASSSLDSNSLGALVTYDFGAGDTPSPKNGWSFANSSWTVLPVPNTDTKGLQFTFEATRVGEYQSSELRFVMPPSNNLWLKFRLHVPQNYEHRFDTLIHIPASAVQNWQIGDQVQGADGSTTGIISGVVLATYGEVPSTGIFLRNPPSAWDNGVWIGTLHNITRNEAAVSTGRQMWSSNNKLLSMWTDGYSSKGLGSSIALEFWPKDAPYGTAATGSDLAVHYSSGDYKVLGTHMGRSTFITAADHGKYIDVIFHTKLSTSAGAKNGVLETWLRREGQGKYTQIHDITDAHMDPRPRGTHAEANWVGSPSDLQPFQRGYLMGWSNAAYDENTSFFISHVEYFQQLPSELE